MELTMYMVTHKQVDYVPMGRTPIFVGGGNNSDHYRTDSTGDNISSKNSTYCELTAYYWIWKNDSFSDYISIEHYRRFFCTNLLYQIVSKKKMEKKLSRYMVITSKKHRVKGSLKDFYYARHIPEDLLVVEKIIKEKCPEYYSSFLEILSGDSSPMFNMIAIKKDKFDEYCTWLFGILFEAEKIIDLGNRSDYQKRAYGFLSERLMAVWIKKNLSCNDVLELPVYYLKENRIKSKLATIYRNTPRVYDPKKPKG